MSNKTSTSLYDTDLLVLFHCIIVQKIMNTESNSTVWLVKHIPTIPTHEHYFERTIIIYSGVLYIGAIANIIVLCSLRKTWRTGERGQFFFLHLTIANLLALFLNLGTRIAWAATVAWLAGGTGCKIVMFFSPLGMFLVHNTVAAFGVDNALGILTMSNGKTRRYVLLCLAWILTLVACSPRPFVYSVQTQPQHPSFQQCLAHVDVTGETAYDWTTLVALYLLPLVCITVGNGIAVILWSTNRSPPLAEKPDATNIITGRRRWSLELYISIVLGIIFFICWSPTAIYRMLLVQNRTIPLIEPMLSVFTVISMMTYVLIPVTYGVYWLLLKRRGQSAHGLEPKPAADFIEK